MRTINALVELDEETRLLVGSVPGWPGAHSQGSSIQELAFNLCEVIALLLDDGKLGSGSEPFAIRLIRTSDVG